MDATCVVCGETFTTKSWNAKYCSERCRKRRQRHPAAVVDLPAKPKDDEPKAGPVLAATIRDLERAGKLDTTLGALCLTMAARIDRPGLDTGASFASVIQKLKDTLAEVTRGSGQTRPEQLADELAAQRAKHGA